MNEFDIIEALMIASKITATHEGKEKQHNLYLLTKSPFEGNYIGSLGEIAVCRYFGIPHPRSVNRTGKGDGGKDLNVNGWRVQVKATPTNKPIDQVCVIMHDLDKFKADVVVQTRIKSLTTVEIIGYISYARFHALKKNDRPVFNNDWYVPCTHALDVDRLMQRTPSDSVHLAVSA